MRNAKKQTLLLTLVNAVVRALGLWMRVLLSRFLGAEIMGITELCSSVHMLAITPLTSGLPLAISRLTAKSPPGKELAPLQCALGLVRKASYILIPLLLLLSPLLARLMQDERVLPSLWLTAPCILILGYSASFNGYCYGVERSWIPAVSELIEQVLRLGITILLILTLTRLATPWMAAIPVFSTLVAEAIGLLFVLLVLRVNLVQKKCGNTIQKQLIRLAAPTTATRLINTALRSCTAILVPLRLQAYGLVAAEATSQLGLLNGMVMPIVMLPCIFTSALSMVALPRLTKAETAPKALRRLLLQIFGSSAAIGIACAIGIYALAPFLANKIYRTAELTTLFRLSAPLTALTALGHVSAGALAGLGKQKRAMYGTLLASSLTLFLTWCLIPTLALQGAIWALTVGQAVTLGWNLVALLMDLRDKFGRSRPFPDAVHRVPVA